MKKITGKGFLRFLLDYVWMTVAAVLNAISLYTFLNPSRLIAGGFSGLSSALSYIVEHFVQAVTYDQIMSIMYFVLNIPLLICSLIFLRGDFTFKTIYTTAVCSGTLALLPKLANLQFTESRLIAVIFGGVIIGLSMYIASEHNGSNGGTEIIARIVNKYRPEIDLSKVLLMSNVFIMLIGTVIVIIFKGETGAVVVYSLLYIVLGSTIFGMFKRGFNHPQKFMIVTSEYEQIAQDITTYFKRGCTCMDVENRYPDTPEKKIVMVVIQYRQREHLKKLVKQRDPNAFTFVKDVHDVFSRPTFNRSYKNK